MVALFVMMLVIVADVFMRYVFNAPIRGSYDLVGICLVVMVSFGFARVISDHDEILVDLVDAMVPPAVTRLLAHLAGLGSAVVLVFLFWAMAGPAASAYRYGDRSLELGLPMWMVWAVALVGLVGAVLAAFVAMLLPRPAERSNDPVQGAGDGFE